MARVPLIDRSKAKGEVKELYDAAARFLAPAANADNLLGPEGSGMPQPFRVWAHSPGLGKWMLQGTIFFFNDCPWTTTHLQLRQLIVLTVGKRLNSEFVCRHHADVSEKLGVSRDKIDALLDDLDSAKVSPLFNDEEKLLIEFADEMTRTGDVRAKLFEDVRRRYGNQAVVEVTGLIAFYLATSSMCNVFRTEDD